MCGDTNGLPRSPVSGPESMYRGVKMEEEWGGGPCKGQFVLRTKNQEPVYVTKNQSDVADVVYDISGR